MPSNPGKLNICNQVLASSLVYQKKSLCIRRIQRELTSITVSEGTPQPLIPSILVLSMRAPRTMPTTAPVSSSTIGPPLDPGEGMGSNKRCERES